MKKTYQRLPDSELDIMLVLWNNTPPMTRPEIEKVINMKKKLASTTILSLLTRLENKNFVEVTGASISRHLAILKEADLIRNQREGKFIYYELNTSVLEDVMLWITNLKGASDDEGNDKKI